MVIVITSLESEADQARCFDLVEAVPFLQIYGRAEETFLGLNTDISVYMIGETPSSSGRCLVRSIYLSQTLLFYERRQDVIINQCLRAADVMIGYIKSIPSMKIDELEINIQFPWSSFIRHPRVPMFNRP